jgi:hypothetical protein
MDVRGQVRVRRRRVVAAIAGACLAVMPAGCGGAASSTAPPASSTAPAASSTALRATASAPAATAGAVTTPAPTIAPTAAVARIDTRVKVYGNCTTPSTEPAEIVLACADYGVLVEGLHWTSWTTASATAVGTLVYNDCTPNCAEGHHHHVPGTRITLTVPVHGVGGQVAWSQIQQYPEPPGYKTGPYHGGPQPLPTRPI